METGSSDGESIRELDDSGCVQDDPPIKKRDRVYLLDLSDDVLLYILKCCGPDDLKALGYTCERLGRLIKDRSLWIVVDSRRTSTGVLRLRWLLNNVLHAGTKQLMLRGLAVLCKGCLGHSQNLKNAEGVIPSPAISCFDHARLSGSPVWHDIPPVPTFIAEPGSSHEKRKRIDEIETTASNDVTTCPGPIFTLTPTLLKQIQTTCPGLENLALDYCNINCKTTGINLFPPTLKRLSLRGIKCFNPALEKFFLFKIQDYLPLLEFLDLCSCAWMEPSALLALSKLERLRVLLLRDCPRLTEFVAYASLASRYGFRALKVLDLSGSPVGDSEVSALGWLPNLEELYMRSASDETQPEQHTHYPDVPVVKYEELSEWEKQETNLFSMEDMESPSKSAKIDLGFPKLPREFPNCRFIEAPLPPRRPRTQDAEAELIRLDGFNITVRRIPLENGSGDNPAVGNENGNPPNGSLERNNADDAERNNGSDDLRWNNVENNEDLVAVVHNADELGRNNNDDLRRSNGEKERNDEDVVRRHRSDKKNKEDDNSLKKSKSSVDLKKNNEGDNSNNHSGNASDEDADINTDNGREPSVIDRIKFLSSFALKAKRRREEASTSKQTMEVEEKEENSENKMKRKPEDGSNDEEVDPETLSKKAKFSNDTPSTSKCDGNENIKDHNDNNEEPVKHKSNNCDGAISDSDYEEFEDSLENSPDNSVQANLEPDANGQNGEDNEPSQGYIRFCRNQNPVYFNDDTRRVERNHRIIYVNVRRRIHENLRHEIYAMNYANLFSRPPVNPSSLVTDAAIRHFGRADGEEINHVHIGIHGPFLRNHDASGERPNRSNLRVLSVIGYRYITDRSLQHLATAAPHLRHLDISETSVTSDGLSQFRSLRPDCELVCTSNSDD